MSQNGRDIRVGSLVMYCQQLAVVQRPLQGSPWPMFVIFVVGGARRTCVSKNNDQIRLLVF